jgi:hypothetical protein
VTLLPGPRSNFLALLKGLQTKKKSQWEKTPNNTYKKSTIFVVFLKKNLFIIHDKVYHKEHHLEYLNNNLQ